MAKIMEKLATILLLLSIYKSGNCMLSQLRECQTVVVVDPNIGVNCSNTNLSLVNYTCDNLEDVLVSVSTHETTHELGGCIQVNVYPGNYVITSFIAISQNLALIGHDISVTFDFHSVFGTTLTQRPYYLITFANSSSVAIWNVDFHDSPGIIGFENVSHILIQRCSFRYFLQGAVDVYDSPFVTVIDSTFEHNGPVTVIKNQSYRGHSGGLSVGYNDFGERDRGFLQMTNCTFRNNTSSAFAVTQQSTTQLLERFIFTGRGGGCAILINSTFNFSASVENSSFEDNLSSSVGGGLYTGFSGHAPHTVTVTRSRFVNNSGTDFAGGLQFGYLEGLASRITLIVESSVFIQNSALYGGGIYLFVQGITNSGRDLSNFARIYNCTFQGNSAEEFGGAISMASLLFVTSTQGARPLEIVDSNFISNQGGRGGTVCAAFIPVSFGGVITFEKNRGRALVVLNALITIAGRVDFYANDATTIDGGAVYVTSFGQIQLLSGGMMNFTDNRGVLGASIVVDFHMAVPTVYAQLPFNPLCVLLGENATQNPDDWKDVSITFSGNNAVVASGVFLNNLDLCSWVDLQNDFNKQRVFRWSFVSFSNNNYNSLHGRDGFNPEWYVQTPATRIAAVTKNVEAFPGELFQLDLVTEDELGRPTSSVIRLSNVEGNLMINPEVVTVDQIADSVSTINLSFFSYTRNNQFQTSQKISLQTLLKEQISSDTFCIVTSNCPAGYILSEAAAVDAASCQCDFQNSKILDCRGEDILLAERLWGASLKQTEENSLYTYPCPLHYCRCFPETTAGLTTCSSLFNNESPDRQCSCDREGPLCGSCKNGTGVSALLNKCVSCGSTSGLLIAALIVLNIIVLISVMVFIRTPPPSWLYPCIFYVQILPYLTEHFPVTFEKLIPYVYYVSSGLSFYFVYDFCLYPEMSILVSYFLRYLPFLLSVIVSVVILRFFRKKEASPWYGLWWIILLQFTHVVHTSVSILNCPTVPDTDGNRKLSWYMNADISCFKNGHLPLSLLAIFMLFFTLILIALVVLYSMRKLRRPVWLSSTTEGITVVFNESCPWWPGVELGRRLLIILSVVIFPGNIFPSIIILSISMVVFGTLQPYKQKIPIITEMVVAVDVIIMLLLRSTKQIQDDLQTLPLQNAITEEKCSTDIEGITNLTILLLPFFYFPLAVLLVCTTIWLITIGWNFMLMKHRKSSTVLEREELEIYDSTDHVYNMILQDESRTTVLEISYRDSDNEDNAGEDNTVKTETQIN